ncbi:ATP-binding cassette domain-containing protein [Mycoplasma sp. 1654_15]|uniref:ATP-binding cassette domain-containing protein n=1 Tax=Mycoplasma sp. 1654_15 TaxID=2725994 RepID=UPI00144A0289|nr:ABC transporter ATP-binding protein [Mycoplasma sp. 1654_15]QJB71322.1 ABC transporter ATP-binding protein [Mycoplasma sp. 1654_15]
MKKKFKEMILKKKLSWFYAWNIFYVLQFILNSFLITISPFYIFNAINQKSLNYLILWLVIYFVSSLVFVVVNTFNRSMFTGFTAILKHKNLEKMSTYFNKVNLTEYKKKGEGFYYSEIKNNNDERITKYYNSLLEIIKHTLYIASILIFALIFNWIIGLTLLISFLIFSIFPLLFKEKLEKSYKNKVKSTNSFYEKSNQIISYLPSLMLLNKKDEVNKIFKSNIKNKIEAYKNYIKMRNISFWISSNTARIFKTLVNVFIILIFIYIYYNHINIIVFSVSIIVLSNVLLDKFFEQINHFFSNMIKFHQVRKHQKEHLNDIPFGLKIEENLIPLPKKLFSIDIKNLTFSYDKNPLISKLNFKIQQNKKYLIVGKNGSGKSTLAKILLGLEKDYQGQIILNNQYDLKTIDFKSINSQINFISKKNSATCLIEGDLYKNISLEEDEFQNRDKLKQIIKFLNLEVLEESQYLTNNWNLLISLNQKQRIQVARILYDAKPFLIIDEALLNIDKKNLEKIKNYLFNDKNLTLIYISHHIKASEYKHFNEVIEFRK